MDIVGDGSWSGPDEINTAHAVSIGWLVQDDKETVKIAGCLDDEENPSSITAFPRGTVKEIIYVDEKTRPD